MAELMNASVTIGVPGLNGGGVTSGALAAAVAGRAPASASFITKSAESGLSGEIALSSLGGPGILKVAADGTLSVAVGADLPAHTTTGVVVGGGFLIDGGGAAIAAGIKGDMEIPFAGTITRIRVFQDQSGTISISFWKDTLANYPPTVADNMYTAILTATAVPFDSGVVSYPVSAGDIIRHNVNALATSITRVTIAYTMTRSV